MHFDNLLILLLIAGFSFLKWLAGKASEASKNSNPTEKKPIAAPPPLPRAPVESDEAQIRKFLEALGRPPGSTPPSVTPRPTYQKPLVPPELPKRVALPREIAQAPYRKKTFQPKAAEASFEVRQTTANPLSAPLPSSKSPAEAYAVATSPTPASARNETNIGALLRSPSGLRDAIVLREIFGSPRSLQPLELI